ncbi:MAG: hypothetical protein HUJ58_09190 [Erysipelotrichaceae bacterium]|nr:hypothetical protein [Erysipelotrichaceae bacterium]
MKAGKETLKNGMMKTIAGTYAVYKGITSVVKRPVKVYVGRRSMSMGDDITCPNMFCFYLSDDPAEVIDRMYGHGLPIYTSWKGYPGRRSSSSCDEDGIQVAGKISDDILFEILESKDPHNPTYTFSENWYRKIKAHPYIYCE